MLQTYVVIPLFLRDDTEVGAYFRDHRQEIDEVTGTTLIVGLATTVQEGNAKDVVEQIGGTRFPGLGIDDLPCLWVDPGREGKPFAIRLPDDSNGVKRILRSLTAEASRARTTEELRKAMERVQSPQQSTAVPSWFAKAGYGALAATLLFLMGIYGFQMAGVAAPAGARMVLIFIVAIGLAMATSFLGSEATAQGKIPIPMVKDAPIGFSIAGGAAVFIIVMVLGYYFYASI